MKFSEILNRITGLSCLIFGVSWNPSEDDRSIKKRVLYVPSEMEVPSHCVHSVIEIRNFLTSELPKINEKSRLYDYVSAMRKSCNKFLNKCDDRNGGIIIYSGNWGHWANWTFASAYGLDVEDNLAVIIPK